MLLSFGVWLVCFEDVMMCLTSSAFARHGVIGVVVSALGSHAITCLCAAFASALRVASSRLHLTSSLHFWPLIVTHALLLLITANANQARLRNDQKVKAWLLVGRSLWLPFASARRIVLTSSSSYNTAYSGLVTTSTHRHMTMRITLAHQSSRPWTIEW